jgi:hypothetical protein
VILFVAAALYVAALRAGAAVGGPSQGLAPIISGVLLQFVGVMFVCAFGIIEGRQGHVPVGTK